MQYVEARNEFYEKVGGLFGVLPIFTGNVSQSGGLNNESQQVVVMGRALEAGQEYFNNMNEWILGQFGITDWKLKLKPSERQIELEKLDIEFKKIANATGMKNLGFKVDMLPDGDFKYSEQEQPEIPTEQPEQSEDALIQDAMKKSMEE
jgi:hypothetical protein